MLNRNVSALVVFGLVAILAAVLFLASVYVAPLSIPRVSASYGGSGFTTGDEGYPRTTSDAENYTLTIARPTRRISSEYWSIDDYVYSVAPPQDIISVSESAYDRSVSNVDRLAEMYHPAITTDPETVFKLDPDLLLISSSGRADFTDLLRKAGTPAFRMFTDFTSLDEIDRTILLTGYLTGNDATAARVHENFQEAIRRARAKKPATAASPRILGYTTGYGYGDHTVFNDIVASLGGINLGAENGLHGYSLINPEQIVVWDPEWIISGAARGTTHDALQRLLEDPAIAQTTAARKGQILVFDNNIFLPLSPFTTLLIDALGNALYATKS
jgi:ABC-type Fe3+-hydroxamate transport system substrate-binding protein